MSDSSEQMADLFRSKPIASNISERAANDPDWMAGRADDQPVLVDLRGLVLRPGDTLILAFDRLTDDHFHRLRDQLREVLPGLPVAIVGGASAIAAYRPEGD